MPPFLQDYMDITMQPNQRTDLEKQLADLENEEARVLRLFASGKSTEKVWDNLWLEWQDRRRSITQTLASLQADGEFHLANLDAALTIISKLGILYCRLERSDKRKLLREIVDRIVINREGEILRVGLLPPFACLRNVADRIQCGGEACKGKTKTGTASGSCSSNVSYGSPNGASALKTYLQPSDLIQAKQLLLTIAYYERDSTPQITVRQRNQTIRERYRRGERMSDLAGEYGVSPQRMFQIVHSAEC